MLTIIYITICIIASTLAILSFVKKDTVIFGWLSFLLFSIIGMSSVNVETPFCEYVNHTATWSCTHSAQEEVGLIYLFSFIGVLMLVYSILNTIRWSGNLITGGKT